MPTRTPAKEVFLKRGKTYVRRRPEESRNRTSGVPADGRKDHAFDHSTRSVACSENCRDSPCLTVNQDRSSLRPLCAPSIRGWSTVLLLRILLRSRRRYRKLHIARSALTEKAINVRIVRRPWKPSESLALTRYAKVPTMTTGSVNLADSAGKLAQVEPKI